MKLGISLTEQGFDPVPAGLLDWLEAIDEVVHESGGADDG